MDTRKNIVDLESFREMLHISPRVSGQSFAELPFKEEILEFLRFLGHSAQINTLTNGLYHRRYVDYAFLIWEDFVYQVEHKNQKKSNEMYYPRITKVIIHHFMTRKPSIPRRNKVNWHYVRDDILFSTIKVVSRHQNTQQYGAILPIEVTTEHTRNTKSYKEYYACATGEAAPKPKASARKKKGGSASSTTPPTPIATPTPTTTVVAAPRLSAATKDKQPARATSPTDTSDVERIEVEQLKIILRRSRQETHISQHGGFSTDEGTETKSDRESEEEETTEKEEESFDPIPRTPEESEDDGNGEEDQGIRISEEERMHEEEEADELYRDFDINQGRGLQVSQDIEDSHVTLTPTHSDGQQESSSTSSFVTNLLNPIIDPVFRFEDRVKSLEVNFSKLMQTNQSTEAVSNISGLVHQYMHQEMTEAVREAVQIQTDRLQDYLQRENDEFLRTIDDNIKKIIKEQALVEAYDADKTILDSYGESAILKRRREDDDNQEGPSA
nr:hypothetical protein [Tanacetum cinerariifolium]